MFFQELKKENEALFDEKCQLEETVTLNINQVERLEDELRDARQRLARNKVGLLHQNYILHHIYLIYLHKSHTSVFAILSIIK